VRKRTEKPAGKLADGTKPPEMSQNGSKVGRAGLKMARSGPKSRGIGTHPIAHIDASVGCKVGVFVGFLELDQHRLARDFLAVRWVKRPRKRKKGAVRPNSVARRQDSTINGGAAVLESGRKTRPIRQYPCPYP